MDYKDLCMDPHLRDLPFKIELNEHGTIQMTPASNRRGSLQVKIAHGLFSKMPKGEVITECSVETSKGTKVADVAWASAEFVQRHGFQTPYTVAPELCVEITSPSNATKEMEEKIDLYLAKGAKEVWICTEDGSVEFHSYEGRLPRSRLAPDMPCQVLQK